MGLHSDDFFLQSRHLLCRLRTVLSSGHYQISSPRQDKVNIVCPWALEINIFNHGATKNHYSCPALPGGPWDSLALSGALWCSLALSRVSHRSLHQKSIFAARDNGESMFCAPGPLDIFIFGYQTIKNQYSYSSLHGAPWRSLAHSGVLWCLPVLPSAPWRSMSLSGAP